MVLGANKRYASSSEFSKVFEQNGAYSNASTGTYHMVTLPSVPILKRNNFRLAMSEHRGAGIFRIKFKAEKSERS